MPKIDYTPFRADVRRKMILKGIPGYAGLAELSGVNYETVKAFMGGFRGGKKTATAIKHALNIKKSYGFEEAT